MQRVFGTSSHSTLKRARLPDWARESCNGFLKIRTRA
jgi:hypothetical protein